MNFSKSEGDCNQQNQAHQQQANCHAQEQQAQEENQLDPINKIPAEAHPVSRGQLNKVNATLAHETCTLTQNSMEGETFCLQAMFPGDKTKQQHPLKVCKVVANLDTMHLHLAPSKERGGLGRVCEDHEQGMTGSTQQWELHSATPKGCTS